MPASEMHVPRCGRNEAQEEKTSCVGLSLAGGFHIQVSGSCPHPHPQLCAPSVLSAAKWVFLAPLSHQGDGRWSHESAGLTAQPRPSVGGGGLLSPDHADLPWPGCLWEPPKECGGGGGTGVAGSSLCSPSCGPGHRATQPPGRSAPPRSSTDQTRGSAWPTPGVSDRRCPGFSARGLGSCLGRRRPRGEPLRMGSSG